MLPAGYKVDTDFVPATDGEKLYRARFSHPDAKSVGVFFNGNLSTVGQHVVSTAVKLSKDWHPNFVFVDYRGYGQSTGTPSLETLHADATVTIPRQSRELSIL